MSRRTMMLARSLLAAFLVVAAAGCSDVCEEAAQICADERQVAAVDDPDAGATECEGELAQHAQCIVDAESCARDVVADCWEAATGERDAGEGGSAG